MSTRLHTAALSAAAPAAAIENLGAATHHSKRGSEQLDKQQAKRSVLSTLTNQAVAQPEQHDTRVKKTSTRSSSRTSTGTAKKASTAAAASSSSSSSASATSLPSAATAVVADISRSAAGPAAALPKRVRAAEAPAAGESVALAAATAATATTSTAAAQMAVSMDGLPSLPVFDAVHNSTAAMQQAAVTKHAIMVAALSTSTTASSSSAAAASSSSSALAAATAAPGWRMSDSLDAGGDAMQVDGGLSAAAAMAAAAAVRDIDANDTNVMNCAVWAREIYANLRLREAHYVPQPADYMVHQGEITPLMRAILIDWLVEVAEEHKLTGETLYLTVNYLDRYLALRSVTRSQLQLVGITCMLVAAKYEEVYAPLVADMSAITENTYSAEEIRDMEETVLNTLQYELTAATAKNFLRRFARVAGADGVSLMLSHYLLELTLLEYAFVAHPPSLIAAASVYVSLYANGHSDVWPALLELHTGYSPANPAFCRCILEMWAVFRDAPASSLQAIRTKYSNPLFCRVSLLNITRPAPVFASYSPVGSEPE